MTPHGLTPREAALLWLAAHAEWETAADLGAAVNPPPFASEVQDAFGRFLNEGWAEFHDSPPQANGYCSGYFCLTAAGRLVAARHTPALLHHAGACVGAEHCPVCKEAA